MYMTHVVRALMLRLRVRFALALMVALLVPVAAGAQSGPTTYTVTSEGDLRTAITSAVNGDTIKFASNIKLTQDLPNVGTNVTIDGGGFSLSGDTKYRGLLVARFTGAESYSVAAVSVTIQNLTIRDTVATGGNGGTGGAGGGGGAGMGGALFVGDQATVTVSNVNLISNSAVGGAGGAGTGSGDGGGGGGLGGNGGTGPGGGGGVGAGANGGDGGSSFGTPGAAGTIVIGGVTGLGGGGDGGSFGSWGGYRGGVALFSSTGFGGGGGGATTSSSYDGAGGFGGGGGGTNAGSGSAAGGYGGGGGGTTTGNSANAGGTLGGAGGMGATAGGGGGAGLGGAIFVQGSGTITVSGGFTINGCAVTAGAGAGGGVAGTAAGSALFIQGNTAWGLPTITFGPALASDTVTIAGDIVDELGRAGTVGGATLAKDGAGKVVLSGTNLYSGTTELNAGTLSVSSDSNLGTIVAGNYLSGSGGSTLQLTETAAFSREFRLGSGTQNLGVDSGKVATWSGQIHPVEVGGALNVLGGGTLFLTNSSNSFIQGLSVVGDSTVRVDSGGALGGANISLGDATTGGTLGIAANAGITFTQDIALGTAGGTVDTASGSSADLSGAISGGGSNGFTKTGSGALTLSGTNTFTGGVSLTAGTLFVGNDTNLGDAAGTVSMSNGTTLGLTDTGQTFARGLKVAGTATLDVGAERANTWSGVLSDAASAGIFRLTGGGTLTLSNNSNTYSGGTVVDGNSTLSVAADGALGNGGGLTLGDNSTRGTLNITGVSFVSSRAVTLQSGGGALDAGSATTATFDGAIGGTGGLFLSGGGLFALTNASNAYGGGTSVIGGTTLRVSADGALGAAGAGLTLGDASTSGTLSLTGTGFSSSRAVTLGSGLGATVDTAAGAVAALNGVISGGGSSGLTKAGSGALTVGGTNTFTGNMLLTGGTVNVGTDANLGNAANSVVMSDGTTLGLTASSTFARGLQILGTSTVSVATGLAATWNGLVGDNASPGLLKLTGGGTLALGNGSNSFTGGTTVVGGSKLVVEADGALGATDVEISTVGAVTLGEASTRGTLTIDATDVGGSLFTSSIRAFTLMAGGSTIETVGSTSATLGGIISGAGGLTKDGAGTLALTGSNTFSGTTTVNAGTLKAGSAGAFAASKTLAVGSSGTFDLNGIGQSFNVISGSGTIALNSNAGLTVGTDGSTSSFSGVLSGSGQLTKAGAGTLTLGGTNTFGGGVNLTGGTLSVGSDGNLGDGAGSLSMGDGTTLAITSDGSFGRALNLAGTSTLNSSKSVTWSGLISDWDGASQLQLSGGGIFALTNATNTYSGGTTVVGGSTVQVGADGSLGSGGGVALGDASTTGTLGITGTSFSTTRAITLGSVGGTIAAGTGAAGVLNGVISGGALTKSGAGTLTLGGTNLFTGGVALTAGTLNVAADANLGNAANTLTMSSGTTLGLTSAGFSSTRGITLGASGATVDTASGATGTLDGVISGGALTKSGAGTLTLGGTNLFTGGVALTGGTLNVATDANLGAGANTLTMSAGTTLGLTGSGFSSSRAITLGGSGATVDTGTGAAGTLNGVISGGALTKSGAGTLTLGGTNLFTGGVTLTAGALNVGADANLGGSGAVSMSGGTTLGLTSAGTFGRALQIAGTSALKSSQSITWNGLVSDGASAGTLQVGGGGIFALTNASNSYTGGTSVTGGSTVQAGADGALGSSTGTLTLGDASTAGTLDVAAATYSATRSVSLGAGGGTINTGNTTAASFGGVVSGSGALTKTGTGALTLSGTNTFTGGVALTAGRLNVAGDANLGGLGSVSMSNSTTLGLTTAGTFAHALTVAGSAALSSSQAVTWSGLISNGAAAGTLQITGGGIFALTNASNSYSGGTAVAGGTTLQVGADGALGAGTGGVTLGDTGTTGTLDVTGAAFSSGRNILLGTSGGTLSTSGAAAATFSGVISGTGSLTKSGSGALTLSSTNTYTGGLTLIGGTLNVASDANLGGSGALAMSSGTALGLTSAGTFARALQIAGTSSLTSSQSVAWSGLVSDGASAGTLQVSGGGIFALTNASNSYTGGTSVTGGSTLQADAGGALGASTAGLALGDAATGGTLAIGTAGAFSMGRTVSLGAGGGAIDTGSTTAATFSGVVSGSGALTKSGSGSLTLSGVNTFSGGLALAGGTLIVASDANLGGSGAVSMSNGTTLGLTDGGVFAHALQLTGTSTLDTGQSVTWSGAISGAGGLTKSGSGSLTLSGANTFSGGLTLAAGTLTLASGATLGGSGALAMGSGTTLGLTGGGTFAQALQIVGTSSLVSGQSVTWSGLISDGGSAGTQPTDGGGLLDGANVGALRVSGGGIFALTNAANSYTGGTTVTGGSTVQIGADGALGASSGSVALGDASSTGTLAINTAGAFSTSRAVALGSAGGTVNTGNATSATLSGVVSGSGGLTKSGAGTLTLAGANTYAGATTVLAGFLQSGRANIFGQSSSIAIGDGATVDLNGFNQTLGSISGAGTLTLGNSAMLTLGGDNSTSTFTGTVGGSGGITKNGTGTLTLGGTNTFTGGLTINAGTLWASASGLGGNIVTDAQIGFDQAVAGTFGGTISGTGTLLKRGAGSLTLTGTNSYTGGTLVSAGSLIGTTGSLQGAFVNNGELVFDQATTGTFAGLIAGTGALTKQGVGTVNLLGSHSYSGLTWVRAGTLAIDAVLPGSLLVEPGATLQALGSIGGSLNLAGSLIVPPGSGVASLTARAFDANRVSAGTSSQSFLINGDLNAAPGSSINLWVSPTSPSPLVVSGAANLVGTHFSVDISDPNPSRTSTYQAISAGSLNIQGGDIVATSSSFEPVLKVDGAKLMVTLLNYNVPLTTATTGTNSSGAAGVIDATKKGATGDWAKVIRELTALGNSELNTALAEMSGEIQASTIRLSQVEQLSFTTTLQNQTSDVENESQAKLASVGGGLAPQMWFNMGGGHSSFSSGENSGGSANMGGGNGGVSVSPTPTLSLGAGGGLSLGGLSLSEISGSSQIQSPRAFFHGSYKFGRFRTHWGGSNSWSKTTTKRQIQFAATVPNAEGTPTPLSEGVNREATSEQKSTARDIWADVQYTRSFGDWTTESKFGLRHASFSRKGYEETGADSISLKVAPDTLTTQDTNVDVRGYKHAGTWRPDLWFSYRREFGVEWAHAQVAFAGAPDNPFSVQGMPIPRTIIQGLLGLTMRTRAKFGYTVEYSFMHTSDEFNNSVRFKLKF